jgi:hypothetical protein
MTLSDLYNALDWANTDGVLEEWQQRHAPEEEKENPDPEFMRNFRCTLLSYALPAEIVGPQPDFNSERQQAARWALNAAGVWQQVLDYLVRNQLLDGPAKRQGWRDKLFAFVGEKTHLTGKGA